jgi:AcrR family transcriptional regulator
MQEPSGSSSSRSRILQAAKHLFAQLGYENTSISLIARTAGSSESQLVKHFGSKCGLLEAIFDEGWQTMGGLFTAVTDSDPPGRRLSVLLEQVLAGLNGDPELKELLLFESRCLSKRRATTPIPQGFLGFTRQLNVMLQHMRERNELRTELSPEAVCAALIALCEGMLRDELVARHSDTGLAYTIADFKRVIEQFLQSLLVPEVARQATSGK